MKKDVVLYLLETLHLVELTKISLDDIVASVKFSKEEQEDWDIYSKNVISFIVENTIEDYEKMFTETESKALLKFSKTSVGKKYLDFLDKTYELFGYAIDTVINDLSEDEDPDDDIPNTQEMN